MTDNFVLIHHDHDTFERVISEVFPDLPIKAFASEEEADGALADANVLITPGLGLSKEMLAEMKKLKWVQCLITGVDHLLPMLERRKRIRLTNARGIHGPQMTEMIIFHMLSLNRQAAKVLDNKAAHRWARVEMKVLSRKTAVIVGVGAIAEHCAKVLKALGMTTVGVTAAPRKLPGFDRMIPRTDIAAAAAEADFLIVLAPYSPENDKLISAEVIAAMKPSAFIINVARGAVIDEKAMIKALKAGKIAGAGLDVFVRQPLPKSSPLWDMENVFITPQSAWMSEWNAENAARQIVLPNLKHWLAGEPDKMINVVKP